ncbi:MAG: glutamate-5-semialdehyde dehydrogenase [Parachlamydiaceae bacterium]
MKTTDLHQLGIRAKESAFSMAQISTDKKNQALETLAQLLNQEQEMILKANKEDMDLARLSGLCESMIERLSLFGRISALADDVRKIAQLCDPIGEEFEKTELENGLKVCKRRTPIGVLGVIYESRPNVTIDVSALTIKSGNCAILRGGSEAFNTNQALLHLIQKALETALLPKEAIQMLSTPDRESVKELLRMHETIDLIIPRGGAQLHLYCKENSSIPVITGGIGICHLFIDESADQKKALEVIDNAKTQRPTVCNALDTLLVHEKIAPVFVLEVIKKLQEKEVEFRVDSTAWQLLGDQYQQAEKIVRAKTGDWDSEWLDLILGIRIVKNVEEAMRHIRQHSTGHSDGILTENPHHAQQFLQMIDSAAVYVNASTRFTDGGQLGLGAEVAISTQKLHARGPMGLKELTSYKWIIQGDYHIRP